MTNYEKGLYFELGRAHELGETPEKGWDHQFRIETKDGPRVLDAARTQGRGVQGVERKSGRVNEVDARAQLRKDRDGLNSGLIARSRWETVAGEKIPDKVREDLRDMARDFGEKFEHVIISRDDALRAIQLGQSLASKQLELIRPYELQRADRARERLAKIRQIVRAQDRAEKFRKMQQFREAAARGRSDAPQKVERDRQVRAEAERARQARQTPEAERARIEREAAERVAQEFPVPSQYQARETADTGEQAAREVADAASVEREADQARAAAAEREREAASKALDEARNAAFKELDEKGRLSEVERLVWLGQATHPQAAVRQSPGRAPSVERGGTGQGQDRSRNVSRDR
ncbi:cell envelope integrity protein TolA [Nocardia asiatica]|uniref:cell envelope integrity protein TolA n=1 Tax=Nocardia asiatica TaxID=209252 RepID=UPI003EE3875F